MLTKTRARLAQPPSRAIDRILQTDGVSTLDDHWPPTDRRQGLAISHDAACLQTEIEALAIRVFASWRTKAVSVSSTQERDRRRFLDRLHASFDAEPLEDGMDHPAEQVITVALASDDPDKVLRWVWSACLESESPAFAAATFLCAARQPGIGTAAWRAGLVRGGLASGDIELRDAAIQAAESWGEPGLREILAAHSEPVSWLDEYRRGVMDDLVR